MKICLINNLFLPLNRGGAEEVVRRIATGLVARGHSVVLITGSERKSGPVVENGIRVYRLSPHNLFFYLNLNKYSLALKFVWHLIDIFNFALARHIQKILRAEAPDVVHTHNLMGMSFLTPFLIRKLNIRHIHSIHDVQLIEPSGIIAHNQKINIAQKIYANILQRVFGSPSVVLCSSQAILDLHKKMKFFPNSLCKILRNPVELVECANSKNTNELKFLFVGQIEKHKGVDNLIEAFSGLQSRTVDVYWELNIIGDGSMARKVKERVGNSGHINFLGRLNHHELGQYWQKGHALVVPSLCCENTPTVIGEAMAHGLLVVASNASGVSEFIKDSETGLVFKTGDGADLFTKIMWCFANRAKVQEIGSRAKNSVAGFSVDKHIFALEKFYESSSA